MEEELFGLSGDAKNTFWLMDDGDSYSKEMIGENKGAKTVGCRRVKAKTVQFCDASFTWYRNHTTGRYNKQLQILLPKALSNLTLKNLFLSCFCHAKISTKKEIPHRIYSIP